MNTKFGKFSATYVLVFLMMIASLTTGCGDDHEGGFGQPALNIGGTLTRNDEAAVPLFINTPVVSWHGDDGVVEIILANDWVIPTGSGTSFESMQSINFTLPDDQLGEELELNDDNASMSEHVPQQFPENAPVKEEFFATHAEGTITLFSFWDDPALLNPSHANGVFEVVFTDDDGNTRKIEKGFFNF